MKKRILYSILNEWRDEDMDDTSIDLDDMEFEPTSSNMSDEPDLDDDEFVLSTQSDKNSKCVDVNDNIRFIRGYCPFALDNTIDYNINDVVDKWYIFMKTIYDKLRTFGVKGLTKSVIIKILSNLYPHIKEYVENSQVEIEFSKIKEGTGSIYIKINSFNIPSKYIKDDFVIMSKNNVASRTIKNHIQSNISDVTDDKIIFKNNQYLKFNNNFISGYSDDLILKSIYYDLNDYALCFSYLNSTSRGWFVSTDSFSLVNYEGDNFNNTYSTLDYDKDMICEKTFLKLSESEVKKNLKEIIEKSICNVIIFNKNL